MSASPVTENERIAWREANRGFLARRYPPASVREQLERPRQLDRSTWRLACEMGWTAIFADPRMNQAGLIQKPAGLPHPFQAPVQRMIVGA